MPTELTLALALLTAAAVTFAATPLAAKLAHVTGFLDDPVGYKGHSRPTPYLGGSAIIAGILVAVVAFGGAGHGRWPLLAGAVVLWVVGTIDDRVSLSPFVRLGIEILVAGGLFSAGLGWGIDPPAVDLLLTVAWVVGVVNAVNLMDNMDGAAATVAGVSALGAGVLALVAGNAALAVLCVAVAGACAGFLPRNLARPARIFMGDGGSMPLGFLVAGLAMISSVHAQLGTGGLVVATMILGLAVLDTTLVTFSRRVGGRPVLQGGRDHLTHRLRTRLDSPQAVAAFLGGTQLLLCGAAIGVERIGTPAVVTGGVFVAMLATFTIVRLNRWPWFDRRTGPRLGPEFRRQRTPLMARVRAATRTARAA